MMNDSIDFTSLGINDNIAQCLNKMNFTKPSDIQEMAIPDCLAGKDVIVQAHAGTGKTLCYLSSLAQLGYTRVLVDEYDRQMKIQANNDVEIIQNIQNVSPYAIILVPTRELAIQVMEIYSRLTQLIIINSDQSKPKLYLELIHEVFQPKLFIGGLPVEQDRDILKLRRCSIVIGTLGRIMQLVKEGVLSLHNIKLVILDEADKLYENKHFPPNFKKIMTEIVGREQENHKPQILSFSATYPEKPLEYFKGFMTNPIIVSTVQIKQDIQLDPDNLSLPNLEQFYFILQRDEQQSRFQLRMNQIVTILRQLSFRQTIIFYNDKNRGENLFNDLRAEGFKPIFIHGDQSQSDRIKVMHQMRRNKVNLIISTDLLSRGIDVETLDIVIHFDLPVSIDTYFHRIGRTGRFGTYGFSILLLDDQIAREKYSWTQEWNNNNYQRVNERIQDKYQVSQEKKGNKEYFGEFLNGVSNWRDSDYQFYDQSKFKYKEDDQQPLVNEPVVLFKRKENKILKKKENIIINQSHDHKSQDLFKCKQCKEFVIQLQTFQQKELKIFKYFQ